MEFVNKIANGLSVLEIVRFARTPAAGVVLEELVANVEEVLVMIQLNCDSAAEGSEEEYIEYG